MGASREPSQVGQTLSSTIAGCVLLAPRLFVDDAGAFAVLAAALLGVEGKPARIERRDREAAARAGARRREELLLAARRTKLELAFAPA